MMSISCSAQNMVAAGEMYLFGVAFSPVDSVVYVTELQPLSGAYVSRKTKFLQGRNEYSGQLKEYMESCGRRHMTVAVSYATKKKSAEKKYLSLKQKYQKSNYLIKYLTEAEFSFTVIPFDEITTVQESAPVQKPAKKKKKK